MIFFNIFKFSFLSGFPRSYNAHHNLQNLLQIYAHSMPVKDRNLLQTSLLLPLCYYLYTHYICLLQTQQCIVIKIIPYNLLSFKETEIKKGSKYISTEFVCNPLIYHFWFSSFLFDYHPA